MGVFATNLTARVAILDDGRLAEITNFFDQFGDECDAEDAATCVVKINDDEWMAVDLRDAEMVRAH